MHRLDKIDQDSLAVHRAELSYLCGRFMIEHLTRLHTMFAGDLLLPIVLGTIAHQNVRRFYDEVVVKSTEPMSVLVARGEHLPHIRPCNAMSVSMATGIPRETVRRKIRWLTERGWVQQVGRDKLFVTRAVSADFADFDLDMLQRVQAMSAALSDALSKRLRTGSGSTA